MLLKDFREPLLSFELIYFIEISFVIEQRIVEVSGIKFWAMWVPQEKTLIFCLPWDH